MTTTHSEEDLNHGGNGNLVSLLSVKNTLSTFEKLSEYAVREVDSRDWLENRIQNRWWNELEWNNCDTDSQFTDAYLCDLWQDEKKKSFCLLSIGCCAVSQLLQCCLFNRNRSTLRELKVCSSLSEYQVCREILWMFHMPAQMAVFQKNSEDYYSVRSDISIPSLTPVSKYIIFTLFI